MRREVFEESGIRAGAVHYHSSQPWPFPGNARRASTPRASSEEITIDTEEMLDVRWFSRAEISDPEQARPPLPRADSIARRLDRGLDGGGMRRSAGFALLAIFVGWGLVACSSAPPANTAQGRCEQQVYDDPAFKAVLVGLVDAAHRSTLPGAALLQARRKSVYNCLGPGLAPRGGVQSGRRGTLRGRLVQYGLMPTSPPPLHTIGYEGTTVEAVLGRCARLGDAAAGCAGGGCIAQARVSFEASACGWVGCGRDRRPPAGTGHASKPGRDAVRAGIRSGWCRFSWSICVGTQAGWSWRRRLGWREGLGLPAVL